MPEQKIDLEGMTLGALRDFISSLDDLDDSVPVNAVARQRLEVRWHLPAPERPARSGRGRPPRDQVLVRRIAEEAVRHGDAPGVHKALAAHFDMTVPTVKDYLRAARHQYQFLAPTAPGQRSFRPGPGLGAAR